METFLIDEFRKLFGPDLNNCEVCGIETVELGCRNQEPKSNLFRMQVFLNKEQAYLLSVDDLKF